MFRAVRRRFLSCSFVKRRGDRDFSHPKRKLSGNVLKVKVESWQSAARCNVFFRFVSVFRGNRTPTGGSTRIYLGLATVFRRLQGVVFSLLITETDRRPSCIFTFDRIERKKSGLREFVSPRRKIGGKKRKTRFPSRLVTVTALTPCQFDSEIIFVCWRLFLGAINITFRYHSAKLSIFAASTTCVLRCCCLLLFPERKNETYLKSRAANYNWNLNLT